MSRKNNLQKRKKKHEFYIRLEQEAAAEAVKRKEKRDAKQEGLAKKQKKAKVEPVVANKKKLAKQLKALSLGDKKTGIHGKVMSDSSDEEAMEVDQVGGAAHASKGIKKKQQHMSRATYIEMKKLQKRLSKSGCL